jgi:hypothetical protein
MKFVDWVTAAAPIRERWRPPSSGMTRTRGTTTGRVMNYHHH